MKKNYEISIGEYKVKDFVSIKNLEIEIYSGFFGIFKSIKDIFFDKKIRNNNE